MPLVPELLLLHLFLFLYAAHSVPTTVTVLTANLDYIFPLSFNGMLLGPWIRALPPAQRRSHQTVIASGTEYLEIAVVVRRGYGEVVRFIFGYLSRTINTIVRLTEGTGPGD